MIEAETKMRVSHPSVKKCIADLVAGFTVETTPRIAETIKDYRQHLRSDTTVYIASLPGANYGDVIAAATRLKREGFNPVPHFAARAIPNKRFLDESLRRLKGETDLQQVFIIAGSVDKPVGEFTDSMQLLETGLFDKYSITRIGVAGHPEGNPDIPDDAIRHALRWKNDFTRRTNAQIYIVTQFCFESKPIIEWDKRIQCEGNRLPIYVGVPGLATLKTLLRYGVACGVGPSMRFLSKQAHHILKLMTVAAPDKLVTELARYRARDSKCGIAGVHMFPLGGLAKSAKWSYAVSDGQFTVDSNGEGFTVDMEPLACGGSSLFVG